MSKVAFVGDMHFGLSPNNSLKFEIIFESQKRFISNCLIPTLKAQGIKDIVFVGDIYDQRRRVDSLISQYIEDIFQNELADFNCIVVQGNHDTYYKDDLSVSALSNIKSKSNVRVVSKITPIELYGKKFLFTPWLTTELSEQFIGNVSKISGKFDYLVGHFETIGFPFEGGDICLEGIDPAILYSNFKRTISGHFHTQTFKEMNGSYIHYLGTPYQLTFAECGEVKGFHIFDLDADVSTFVENTHSAKFIRVNYPRDSVDSGFDIEGNFVELRYDEKTTDDELFVVESKIRAMNPASFKSYMNVPDKIEDMISDRTEEDVKIFEDMTVAIISENMISMTKVFLEAKPYHDPEIVLELIEEIRATVTG